MFDQVIHVTVLVPARNEAGAIGRCLDAVIAQDFPASHMEVIVVDGASTDGTAAIAEKVLHQSGVQSRVVVNDEATTPSNLNVGLALARGRVTCRVDARSVIPDSYVRTCVEILDSRPDVGVVGGSQRARVHQNGSAARGIARALNNRLVMGGARYRTGGGSGPTDTVYLGAFRTQDLRAIGGWSPVMRTNQDFELNQRYARDSVVWFEQSLEVLYEPRSNFWGLFRQYHRFGSWKMWYWRSFRKAPLPRQRVLIALPFAGGLAFLAIARRASWPTRLALGATAPAALLLVDEIGSDEPAGASERLTAVVAMIVIGGGWLSGIARSLVRSTPSG